MSQTTAAEVLAQLSKSRFLGDEKNDQSFAYMLAYYRTQSKRKRIWFRTFSVALLVMSSSLPVVAAFGDKIPGVSKDVLVAVISGCITLLTGLLSFYRWEVGWRGQNEAGFALRALYSEWEGAQAIAQALPDDQAIKVIGDAFMRLQSKTFEVVNAEMGEFFKVQKLPSGKAT